MTEIKLVDLDSVQRNCEVEYAFRRFAMMSNSNGSISVRFLARALLSLYKSDQVFVVGKPIELMVSEESSPVHFDAFKRHVNDLEANLKWLQHMIYVYHQQMGLRLQIGLLKTAVEILLSLFLLKSAKHSTVPCTVRRSIPKLELSHAIME